MLHEKVQRLIGANVHIHNNNMQIKTGFTYIYLQHSTL